MDVPTSEGETDDEAAHMRKSEQDEKKMQDEYKEELKITETKKKSIMQALRDRYSKYPKNKIIKLNNRNAKHKTSANSSNK